ncbi:DUF1659 domain-containing protein [Staphylococcus simulans]|uniref:DUF1659 domain-containing protein n=1 Tax=Staphylococcus simulans TaxID=1286 RepID=UPI0021CFD65B|nr:hypothetical protein [Staphylococcus simulans]UXV42726.1 hypothetical protein MUA12_01900 [Staphylococcus simulans]
MKTIKDLAVTLIRVEDKKEAKPVIKRRRFARLNPQSTETQLNSFKSAIEKLTGETYDNIEVTTVETL